MKIIKKVMIPIMLMLTVMFLGSSCCSAYVYSKSKQRVAYKRAVARGDEPAMKAIVDGDFVGLAIDITALDVLAEQPGKQIGAAILDAGLAYGTYAGAKAIDKSMNKDKDDAKVDSTVDTSGNYNTINNMIIINKDGAVVGDKSVKDSNNQ